MKRGTGELLGRVIKALVVFAAVGLTERSRAENLLTDFFDYPDGGLVTASGTQWSTHSGTANQVSVLGGELQLSASNTEDVNALLAGQPYDSAGITNRFYASFRVRFTSLPSASGTYFAHFKGASSTAFAGRIWALTSGAAPGKFRLGISSTSSSSVSATAPMDLELNTDYTVVTRLVNSDSVTKLWINPTAESDPSISSSEPAEAFTVVAYAFRENTGEGSCRIDDLRVGTSFADAVTNAPFQQSPTIVTAPQNTAAVEGATAQFSVSAEAVPTPTFQWRFNGLALPGAVSSNLTLANVSFADSGFYSVTISNALDEITSEPAVLNVFSASAPAFSLLTYNLHGNGVLNWSTNTAHVRSIGRQVEFLDPDILTFQEIPVTNNGTAQMENFVAAFRRGFYLATNSSDDLYIRSVILSRFPIVASRSWLHASDLTPFGYTNSGFTRDLFEAEIAVPGFPQPLHVFTIHLKSSQDNDSAAKRAAEAGAVSNFFVTGFLTTNSLRPYILTGDMNEDILRPAPSDPQSVQRLISAPTGLQLTTPFNFINNGALTFSIQSANGLSRRYDYILPCGLLWSNAVSSEIFRTDLLDPVPANLFSNDDQIASDHLPVRMVFANPYTKPFRVSIWNSNETVNLSWPCTPGQAYRVENSSNLTSWTPFLDNVLATNADYSINSNRADGNQFFRVRRLP
ncbi:MAG: immunoglobulin domain-containing protein [Verrucomicrobiota bacterium]